MLTDGADMNVLDLFLRKTYRWVEEPHAKLQLGDMLYQVDIFEAILNPAGFANSAITTALTVCEFAPL